MDGMKGTVRFVDAGASDGCDEVDFGGGGNSVAGSEVRVRRYRYES